MNKYGWGLLVLVLGMVILRWVYLQIMIEDGFRKMKVGGAKVKVEVRDTMVGRAQGLSGRERLEKNEGMLFVFDNARKHEFWMKGMKFDLDFVWINSGKVVEIIEEVKAPGKSEVPERIKPKQKANMVLEVNSGWVERHKIKTGDVVIFLR